MPRVHHVTAAKDYPEKGIAKGEKYYHWKFRHGPKVFSKTAPRRSQLTQSDKLSRCYAAEEDLNDEVFRAGDLSEIAGALRQCAEAVREVAEEYEESAENIESVFTGGSQTAEDCRDKAAEIEAWANEMESAADEIESMEADDDEDEDDLLDNARDKAGEPSCPF